MNLWSIVNYDVWGNAEEGFEVNDVFVTGSEVELPEDYDKEDVQRLFSVPVDVDTSNEGVIYVERESDGKPVGELRLKEEGEILPWEY